MADVVAEIVAEGPSEADEPEVWFDILPEDCIARIQQWRCRIEAAEKIQRAVRAHEAHVNHMMHLLYKDLMYMVKGPHYVEIDAIISVLRSSSYRTTSSIHATFEATVEEVAEGLFEEGQLVEQEDPIEPGDVMQMPMAGDGDLVDDLARRTGRLYLATGNLLMPNQREVHMCVSRVYANGTVDTSRERHYRRKIMSSGRVSLRRRKNF